MSGPFLRYWPQKSLLIRIKCIFFSFKKALRTWPKDRRNEESILLLWCANDFKVKVFEENPRSSDIKWLHDHVLGEHMVDEWNWHGISWMKCLVQMLIVFNLYIYIYIFKNLGLQNNVPFFSSVDEVGLYFSPQSEGSVAAENGCLSMATAEAEAMGTVARTPVMTKRIVRWCWKFILNDGLQLDLAFIY